MTAAYEAPEQAPQHDGTVRRLHLGCGDDDRAGWLDVDANPESSADIVADVTDTPWEWADARAVEVIEAHHLIEHVPDRGAFFREAARVLAPDGRLTVTVPLGANWTTDDDHEPPAWTWETPLQYSSLHRRPWDPALPLQVVDRSLDVWLAGPTSPASPLLQAAATVWPAWAAERCYAGELTVSYRKRPGLADEASAAEEGER